jgi:hypothetical protein
MPSSWDPCELEEMFGIPEEARVGYHRRTAPVGFNGGHHESAAAADEVYIFVDDCDLDTKRYVGRGGFAVRGSRLGALGHEFQGILLDNGVPLHDPLASTEVCFNPKPGNYFRDLQGRHEIFGRLLESIKRHGGVAFGTVIVRKLITKEGWTEGRAKLEGLTYTAERVESYLVHEQIDGKLFIDEEGAPKGQATPQVHLQTLIARGSDFRNFKRLSGRVRVLKSKDHFGVQLADLVVGTTTRRVADFIQETRGWAPLNAETIPITNALWGSLQGSFFHVPGEDQVQNPQAYGLVILPTPYSAKFARRANPYS